MANIINPKYDDIFTGLPEKKDLVNPLIDIELRHKERGELEEFYKLSNEFYSPAFGIKYLLNVELYPFQMAIILALLNHKFPILLMSRGAGKTTLLAIFAVYYAIMNPGTRIILVSAGFRQSKLIFQEIKRIYDKSPLLKLLASDPRISTDRCYFDINNSSIVALPLGQGDKIRGERGHVILVDEFDSMPIEIFDVVVRGFGATQANPFEKTRNIMLAKKGRIKSENILNTGNKIILSGTAGYKNGPLYRMYSQYSKIIDNQISGNLKDYKDVIEHDYEEDVQIQHEDYCIVKFKYTELPPGLMELSVIHNARATMPKTLFNMEYNAEFGDDTAGYFKFKDIENATSKFGNPDCFNISLSGKGNRQYIMGVDPARTTDRFAISIIELGTKNKLVYCWTCQNQKYSYAVTQIRKLLRSFNIIGIAIDPGGGGLAIEEMLQSEEFMNDGEKKIYRHDDDSVEAKSGLRILYSFDFTSSWIEDANAILQKNIEDANLMFPFVTSDETNDDIEDVLYEIKELKKELTSIEITYTKSGKKHFDLMPADINKTTEDVVRHKDRYSSLLLSNYLSTMFNKITDNNAEEILKTYNDPRSFGGWIEDFA